VAQLSELRSKLDPIEAAAKERIDALRGEEATLRLNVEESRRVAALLLERQRALAAIEERLAELHRSIAKSVA
jgi:hypothetical protein